MDSIIRIESSPISLSGYCYINTGQTVNFSIISGITGGILVTYEWYLIRDLVTTLVGIGSGLTLTSLESNDQIYVKVINCNGSSGSSGTAGTSGTSGTNSLNLIGNTDNQIIVWSGNTWEVSNKLILPGSFIFDPPRGIMEYETLEDGHYEIAIFGNDDGLTGVTNGDILVFNDGYWVNSAVTFNCHFEDIYFYYNDIISGTSQVYYIDLKSSFGYRIISIILQSDKNMNNAEIQINGTPILWTGSTTTINITNSITETSAYYNNFVPIGNSVTLNTFGDDDGTSVIQGKIKYIRETCIVPTTTTTTTLASTTTTTTLAPTTTTTTTLYITTTMVATTTLMPTTTPSPMIFELFGQMFNI